MGTLVFVFLLLAVPLVLQLRGRNVSAQLFAVTLLLAGSPLFFQAWSAKYWTGAMNAAISRQLFEIDPFDDQSARSYDLPGKGLNFLLIFAVPAVIVSVQERVHPAFFRHTKRIGFWISAASCSYMFVFDEFMDLGRALWNARHEPTAAGLWFLNFFTSHAHRHDATIATQGLTMMSTMAVILVLSILGILVWAFRKLAART